MKTLMIVSIASLAGLGWWFMRAQKGGKVIVQEFVSTAISGNLAGEDAKRRVAIYLPPGYEKGTERYPVIYFLHGYTANEGELKGMQWDKMLDAAIADQRIKPVILVVPSSYTTFGGSFYANSSLTGNWADYIAKDLVDYIDKNYRTLAHKDSRGLAGHSMGGNGALRIGMAYPDVFGSVYALSPSVLDWAEEFGFENPGFRVVHESKSLAEVSRDLYANILVDMGRTYSPDPQKKPFQAAMPVEFAGDSMYINREAVALWEARFPMRMLDQHLPALKGLKGLKIDWGKEDEFWHIPVTCRLFDQKLKEKEVAHEAEEYSGGHGNMLGGDAGRINKQVIPFFARHLSF